jgi:20S proteasome subunit alpha 6
VGRLNLIPLELLLALHSLLSAPPVSNFIFPLSQEKVFKIDQHLGVSVSGLIADARVLSKFMHSEALNHRFVFSSDMQVARLVQMVADKSQVRAHFL